MHRNGRAPILNDIE